MFFEMLTGRRLFRGETVTDVLAAVVQQPIDLDAPPKRSQCALDTCASTPTCSSTRSTPQRRPSGSAPGAGADSAGQRRSVISWQVAQEFLNVAIHRFERPLTPRETTDYLDAC